MATFVKILGFGCSYIVLLSIFFLLSIPVITLFAVILSLASGLGTVTTLSCKRIEPTQINCRSSESVFFGLIQQKPTSLLRVTAAKSNSEIIKGNKGKIEKNYVTLFTQQGKITVFNNTINVESDQSEMKAITGRINAFINSSEPSLIIKRDLRLDWGRNIGGFIGLFFLSLFLCCLGFIWLVLLVVLLAVLVYNLFRAVSGLLIFLKILRPS